MKRFYCTYFDANYLCRGVAMIRSLAKHETVPWKIFVICLDQISQVAAERLACENIQCLALHDIEAGDRALITAKQNRSTTEYYWTLTPTIILRLLEWHSEITELTYLDSDLFFYTQPQPIFNEFAAYSVLIHGHRFPQRIAFLERDSGTYNVGLLCFRKDKESLTVLRWWRDRCNEWCYSKSEDGKFGDQAYLNSWPKDFPGVGILQNPGAGLAPWNYEQYALTLSNDGIPHVDGVPIVFFHFHAYELPCPDIYIPIRSETVYALTRSILLTCYWPYTQAIHEALHSVWDICQPRYKTDLDGAHISQLSTFLSPSSLRDSITTRTTEHVLISLPEGWDCYMSNKQPILAI